MDDNKPNQNPKTQEYFEIKTLFRDFRNIINNLNDLSFDVASDRPELFPSVRDNVKTMEQMYWEITSAFDVWNFCRGNDEMAKATGRVPGETTGLLAVSVRTALKSQIEATTKVVADVQAILAK